MYFCIRNTKSFAVDEVQCDSYGITKKQRNTMIKTLALLAFAALALSSCQQSEDEKAAPAMARIDSLFQNGHYEAVLDSIESLRLHHPEAIESRRRALKIWQEASLKLAQKDVAGTDSALQATIRAQQEATSLLEKNRLQVKRDSLQARWETMSGMVRVIRAKQQEKDL